KISSAFKPSRLWGPEEPLARYVWMSQRYRNEVLSSDNETTPEPRNYPIYNIDLEKKYADDWKTDPYQGTMNYNGYSNNNLKNKDETLCIDSNVFPTHTLPKGKKKEKTNVEEKFRSPNICIARGKLGGPLNCNCNRHFTLNVPTFTSNETTTSL
ncbi:Transporter, partial [Operophtera brumata]